MKRIISFLMSVVTITTAFMVAVPVLAAEETTKQYQYTQEECKHHHPELSHKEDRYYYFNGGDQCFLCGYVCKHPKKDRVYANYSSVELNYFTDAKKHYRDFTCGYCCKSGIKEEPGEKHKFGKWEQKASWYDNIHTRKCKVCGYKQTGECSYQKVYKKAGNDQTHKVELVCKTCKQKGYIAKDSQKHTYKNNKCTKCGYQRIVPGKLKITTAKNTEKGKKRVVNVEGKWVYSNNQWIWKKPYSYNCYDYKISLNISAKNATKYLVTNSKDKDLDDGRKNRVISKKKSFTYTYTVGRNKAQKVTLYITPISKTGTYGKTVKKVITLKN